MTDGALRITVCGYLVRGPLGGLAWHHLQYVLGLHRLGHDVVFVEDSDDYEACYDPTAHQLGIDPSYGLAFAADAFSRLGLRDRWAYHDRHTGCWRGPLDEPERRAGSADVLLDLSGVNPHRPWWDTIAHRVLVDTDPVFTQLRHLESVDHDLMRCYTAFVSFAENIGTPCGAVPDDGLPWQPTRQPVVLDAWPQVPADPRARWTTVMQWDSYPERRHEGTVYGMKSRSFDPFLDLPSRLPNESFALAVGSASAPRQELAAQGWTVLDPLAVTRSPWTFRDFVAASKGEFSVAKHGYVVSRSGWFSERTVNYLASGRPAVVQDTGFAGRFPTGAGLSAFSTPEEALAAVQSVSADYGRHCTAAREVAAAYFDHRLVLPRLLEQVTSA